MTKRAELIHSIELLYPPDDNEEGRELLILALCNVWRELPLPVLVSLLGECMQREARGH